MACIQSVEAPSSGALLLVGLVLLACTLAALPLTIFLVRALAPRGERVVAGWGWREFAAVIASAFLLLVVAGQVLHSGAQPQEDASAATDVSLEMIAMAVVLGLVGALTIVIARRTTSGGARALGLTGARLGRSVAGGVLGYVLCAPGLLGITLLWTALLHAFGVADVEQPIARELAQLGAADRPLAFALGVLVMPFCEELLFRGFLQASFERTTRPLVAVVITSMLFAALHGLAASVPIFALSLVLGGVLLRTRSLYAAWAVHALHNGLMFAFLWIGSEQWRALSQGS